MRDKDQIILEKAYEKVFLKENAEIPKSSLDRLLYKTIYNILENDPYLYARSFDEKDALIKTPDVIKFTIPATKEQLNKMTHIFMELYKKNKYKCFINPPEDSTKNYPKGDHRASRGPMGNAIHALVLHEIGRAHV